MEVLAHDTGIWGCGYKKDVKHLDFADFKRFFR